MSRSNRGNVWLGAAGLVVNNEGQWLVVRKTYGGLKGKWSIPAGFVDGKETADHAAIREVKEETGIDCKLESMIGFRTGVLNGEISDNMAIFFLSPTTESQFLVPQLKEVSEVAWKSPLELKEDPDSSLLILEMAENVIEAGLDEINDINPGEIFGYTSYKLFFKK
ncbi:NUDIX domain-containing protein [Sporosarcina sp. NPDC096371]|uniref:NUDIX domain-containing protein n=1 Tax=Sporosarcina sp. NPDC096371 TaxID=3364530 RepID=UPI0037FD4080